MEADVEEVKTVDVVDVGRLEGYGSIRDEDFDECAAY